MANQFTPFRFMSETHKECSLCNKIKEHSEFNKDKRNIRCKGLAYYCKTCLKNKYDTTPRNTKKANQTTIARKLKRKLEAVEYFGNKCNDCKNTFPSYCYDFHHLDPSKKDLNIANAFQYKEEIYLEELKKCIMLCANCHRIRHNS